MATSVPARPNHRVLCEPRLYVRRVVFIPIPDFSREIGLLRVIEYTRNSALQQMRRAFFFLLKSCAGQKMAEHSSLQIMRVISSNPQVQLKKSALRLRRAQSVLLVASILSPGLWNSNVATEDNQSHWRDRRRQSKDQPHCSGVPRPMLRNDRGQ